MSLEVFIVVCLKHDNSKDMHTIIEKKVKKHYHRCASIYKSSQEFKELLQTRIAEIERDPKNLHTYVKEIVDELKLRCIKEEPPKKKIKLDSKSVENGAEEQFTSEEKKEDEQVPRFRERAVKKLSKLLQCLQKKIVKLEEKEVDWDDDNDSAYIQLQRYKERAIAVYKKLQEYQNGVLPKLQNVRTISFTGTPFISVNRAIEKYVNKTGQFPDYREVLKLLKSAYEKEEIKTTPEKLRVIAKAAFQNIGEQLQRQRQVSVWNAHSYYLGTAKDPAEEDRELDIKLQENKKEYGSRIAELIEKFAEGSKEEPSTSKEKRSDEEKNNEEGKEEDDLDSDDDDDDDVEDEDDEKDESEEESGSKDGAEDDFIENILTGVAETGTSESDEDDSHSESEESCVKKIKDSDESSKGNYTGSEEEHCNAEPLQNKLKTKELQKKEEGMSSIETDLLLKELSENQAEETQSRDVDVASAIDKIDVQKGEELEGVLSTDISENSSLKISKSESSSSFSVKVECDTKVVQKLENSPSMLEMDNNFQAPKDEEGKHHYLNKLNLKNSSFKCSTMFNIDDDDVIVLD